MILRASAMLSALAALVALPALAPSALADSSAVRKEIQGKYAMYSKALLRKDAEHIMALSTPDFTVVQPGRPPQNRKQAESDMRAMLKSTGKVRKAVVQVADVKVKGSKAVATVHMSFEAPMTDKKGKVHQVTELSTSEDTWVRTKHGWLVQKVRILSDKMTMDGKPMPAAPVPAGAKKQ